MKHWIADYYIEIKPDDDKYEWRFAGNEITFKRGMADTYISALGKAHGAALQHINETRNYLQTFNPVGFDNKLWLGHHYYLDITPNFIRLGVGKVILNSKNSLYTGLSPLDYGKMTLENHLESLESAIKLNISDLLAEFTFEILNINTKG